MTIADQITRLNNAKAAIKESIENKGVSVSDSALLDEYPALIDSIEVGSGGGSGYENPGFYEILTNGGTDYSHLFRYRTISNVSFIESLNTSKVTNMNYAFASFSSSSSLNLSGWNTGNVKSMQNMFDSVNVKEINASGWDTSNVTNMYYLFNGCYSTTIIGLEDWDTSNVTDMQYMFKSCKSLTSLNVSNWNTSKVTNMAAMFNETILETLDISGWDTSNVKDFGSIYWFLGGNSYTPATQKLKEVIGEIDLSSCTSGMVYSSSYWCFSKLPNLETLYLKNIYKNVTMKNELKWSINLKDTIVKDECLIYIINELPDLINDKGLTSMTNIKLTLPPTNTLTQEQVQVAIDKGWNVINTTY